TLHRLGIQAFEPILVDGSAIQIHPLVCAAFNADFDGDQMAVHVPLSAMAKREAREQMLSTNNLLLPSNGEPIVAPTLDMVLGCYYLTIMREDLNRTVEREGRPQRQVRAFAGFEDALQAYQSEPRAVTLQERISVRVPDPETDTGYRRVETTVGRIIFTDTINRALRAAEVDVQVDLPTKEMGKGELKGLVGWLIRRFGNRVAAQVLDEIKRLGFQYATRSGITIAVTDIKVPESKDAILGGADEEIARIEKDYR